MWFKAGFSCLNTTPGILWPLFTLDDGGDEGIRRFGFASCSWWNVPDFVVGVILVALWFVASSVALVWLVHLLSVLLLWWSNGHCPLVLRARGYCSSPHCLCLSSCCEWSQRILVSLMQTQHVWSGSVMTFCWLKFEKQYQESRYLGLCGVMCSCWVDWLFLAILLHCCGMVSCGGCGSATGRPSLTNLLWVLFTFLSFLHFFWLVWF